MNYIIHLNAFFQRQCNSTHLAPLEFSLYMALFDLWNTRRFADTFFTLDSNRLMTVSGIHSENTYRKHLKSLHTKGYLKYYPGPNFAKVQMTVLTLATQDLGTLSADGIPTQVSLTDEVGKPCADMCDGPFTPRTEYTSAISIAGKNIIRLEQEDESLVARASASSDYVVVADKKSITDYWWKSYANKSTYLVSLNDGARKLLYTGGNYITYQFSPGGKYLVYYDPKQYAYFSYHLPSGRLINISGSIPIPLTRDDMDSLSGNPLLAVGIAGWLPDDDALFIYDNFDIWKVDPSDITPPLNITNGYGREHDIKLRAINESPSTIYDAKEPLILAAFNTSNKQNGFYRKAINKKGDPELLTMGPYFAYTTDSSAEPS